MFVFLCDCFVSSESTKQAGLGWHKEGKEGDEKPSKQKKKVSVISEKVGYHMQ